MSHVGVEIIARNADSGGGQWSRVVAPTEINLSESWIRHHDFTQTTQGCKEIGSVITGVTSSWLVRTSIRAAYTLNTCHGHDGAQAAARILILQSIIVRIAQPPNGPCRGRFASAIEQYCLRASPIALLWFASGKLMLRCLSPFAPTSAAAVCFMFNILIPCRTL